MNILEKHPSLTAAIGLNCYPGYEFSLESFSEVNGSLLLFGFFSRETYNALTNWLTDARTLASPNILIILVGNKKDLEAEREVTFLEASRFAQENGEHEHELVPRKFVAQFQWCAHTKQLSVMSPEALGCVPHQVVTWMSCFSLQN